MKQVIAVLAFASPPPLEPRPCVHQVRKKKASKKKKCEKKMEEKLAKMRQPTPIKTSDVGKEFGLPDGQKLFESDDWYLGYKETGHDIDAVNKQVTAAKGLIRLTVYAGHLNKSDKKAAQKLGGKPMPRLKEIQNELNGISEELNKVDMNQYAGMDAVKAGAAVAATTAQVAATLGEVPVHWQPSAPSWAVVSAPWSAMP